jgi:hypothetical protein
MTVRIRHFYCLVPALLIVAAGHAAAQGYDGYPYTIMAQERGAATHQPAHTPRRAGHLKVSNRPGNARGKQYARGSSFVARGSPGSTLPTPLPRTPLIPPENGSIANVTVAPREQGPTVLPSLNPIPNLPHGTETFQDRASRCAFQQGLYNVPGGMTTQYMGACVE